MATEKQMLKAMAAAKLDKDRKDKVASEKKSGALAVDETLPAGNSATSTAFMDRLGSVLGNAKETLNQKVDVKKEKQKEINAGELAKLKETLQLLKEKGKERVDNTLEKKEEQAPEPKDIHTIRVERPPVDSAKKEKQKESAQKQGKPFDSCSVPSFPSSAYKCSLFPF